jgi:CubicO group peptidase (beta-lactamase class C family)
MADLNVRNDALALLAVLALAPTGCAAQEDPRGEQAAQLVQRETGESFEAFLARLQRHYDVPAVAAATFSADELLEVGAAGTTCVGDGVPVTVESRFHVGSLAKSMTAVLAALFVEEGRLRWDMTLGEAFPELAETMDPAYRPATLTQVLMHRGGFAPWWSDSDEFAVHDLVPGLEGTAPRQRERFTEWLLPQPAARPPGEVQYSNAGYVVASVVIERMGGEGWEELVTRRLFEPLGMESAGVGWPRDVASTEPCGHLRGERDEAYAAPSSYHRLPSVFAPTGDLHMSVRDLVVYGMMHLRGLHGRDGLLQAETVQFIHEPVGDYALGWGVGTSPWGERGSSHEGSAGTFFAMIGLSHDRDRGCAVLVNDGSDRARAAAGVAVLSCMGPGAPVPDAAPS